MPRISSAVLILRMPSAVVRGLPVPWRLCWVPVFEPPGKRVWAAFSLPHAQKRSGSPRACCPLLLSFVPFLSMWPLPRLWGAAAFLGKRKAGSRPPLHVYWKLQTSARWDRTLHVRWDYQVSKTCVNYTAKPDPIMTSHKMEIKYKISLALCK